jgi:YD repeat-containing protein
MNCLDSRRRVVERLALACRLFLLASTLAAFASQAPAGSATYQYDSLGRILQIEYATGVILRFSYDAGGNRTVQQ